MTTNTTPAKLTPAQTKALTYVAALEANGGRTTGLGCPRRDVVERLIEAGLVAGDTAGWSRMTLTAAGRTALGLGVEVETVDAEVPAAVADLVEARDPKHAGKTEGVPGATTDRLTIRRQLLGYDVATPRYRWHLLVDGLDVGRWGKRRSDVVRSAVENAAEYLARAGSEEQAVAAITATPTEARRVIEARAGKRAEVRAYAETQRSSGRVYASKLTRGLRVNLRHFRGVEVLRVETWEPRKVLVTLADAEETQLVMGAWAWVALA